MTEDEILKKHEANRKLAKEWHDKTTNPNAATRESAEIIRKLHKAKAGYMVSKERMEAFGALAEGVNRFLNAIPSTAAWNDSWEALADLYDNLMNIVANEMEQIDG